MPRVTHPESKSDLAIMEAKGLASQLKAGDKTPGEVERDLTDLFIKGYESMKTILSKGSPSARIAAFRAVADVIQAKKRLEEARQIGIRGLLMKGANGTGSVLARAMAEFTDYECHRALREARNIRIRATSKTGTGANVKALEKLDADSNKK